MSARSLKNFLVGAALSTLALPGLAMAGTACVYVIGGTQAGVVTTPAIPIVIPSSSGLSDPIRVHLDEAGQNVIGYSVPVPGADAGTDGTPLFSIPAVNQNIPSFSVNIPAVDLTRYRCVDVTGATVPAIPVYIPASAFTIPGGFIDVGATYFNLTGQTLTVPGNLLTFQGKQVLIPQQDRGVPAQQITTPNHSTVINTNNGPATLRYLVPTPSSN